MDISKRSPEVTAEDVILLREAAHLLNKYGLTDNAHHVLRVSNLLEDRLAYIAGLREAVSERLGLTARERRLLEILNSAPAQPGEDS